MKTVFLFYDLIYGINRMIKNYVFSFKNILRPFFFVGQNICIHNNFVLLFHQRPFGFMNMRRNNSKDCLTRFKEWIKTQIFKTRFKEWIWNQILRNMVVHFQYLLRIRASVNNLKVKIITTWYNFSLERKLVWYWLLILILQKSFYVK